MRMGRRHSDRQPHPAEQPVETNLPLTIDRLRSEAMTLRRLPIPRGLTRGAHRRVRQTIFVQESSVREEKKCHDD
jgi:hypothetical protein